MKSPQFVFSNDNVLKPVQRSPTRAILLIFTALVTGVLYLTSSNSVPAKFLRIEGASNHQPIAPLPPPAQESIKAPPAPSHLPPPPSANIPAWRQYYLENFHRRQYNCSENDKEENISRISQDELNKLLEISPRSKCGCPLSEHRSDNQPSLESSCGPEATALGEGQNVISYILFSKQQMLQAETEYFNRRYFEGIRLNLRKMKLHYPEWVMRVYTNVTFEGEVCDLVCSDSDIYFCDMSQNEPLHNMHPRTWRFLPLGDPTVNKFAVRDIDSLLGCRERSAVAEWEDSEFPLHGMRDHPYHDTTIMAGMWGGDNTKLCYKNARTITDKLIPYPWQRKQKNDQQILQSLVYTYWKPAMLNHDSYLCQSYKDSIPFPTQRAFSYEYIGKPFTIETAEERTTPLPKPCPPECRPVDAIDWEYC